MELACTEQVIPLQNAKKPPAKSTLWGKGSPLSNLYPQMPKNPHLPSNHPTRMLPDSSFFSFKIVFYSTTKNGCAGTVSGTAVFGILLNQQVDHGDDEGAVGSLVEQENDQSEQNDPVLIDVEILQDLIDWSLIPSLL